MSDTLTSVPSFLEEDLSKVDTTVPCIRANLTEEVEIVSVEIAKSKTENPIDMLVISVKTVKDLPSTKNETINAGFPLYQRIGLTPLVGRVDKKDRTEQMIKKDVAKFVQATGKSTLMPLEQFKGVRVMIKTAVEPARGQYAESNSISFVKQG